MKELESLDVAFVIDTFLLLLIGIGPKIALRPRFADLETIDAAGQPVADDGPGRIWFSCVKPG